MKRSLALTRETLTELSAGDLVAVAGAADSPSGLTCPALDCLSDHSTCDLTYQPRCF